MELKKAIVEFSNFLCKEYKQELLAEDITEICKDILQRSDRTEKLMPIYGNLSIWLIYYFKKVLNIDLTNYNEIIGFLITWRNNNIGNLISTKSWRQLKYDKLEFDIDSFIIASYFWTEECTLKSDKEYYSGNDGIFCDNLILDMPNLKRVNTRLWKNYCHIFKLTLNTKNIYSFTPNCFYWSDIETVNYEGKDYTLNEFLKLSKKQREVLVNNSSYSNLYVIRYVKEQGWQKPFYYYLFGRKSKKSGKYRLALLSDMGSQRYSTVYFKSKENAEDVLNKNNRGYLLKYLKPAKVRYWDIEYGFKEVECETGGTFLIKKDSPGDVKESVSEAMTEREKRIKQKLCLYLREEGFPRFADYLENFHINLLTSEQAGKLFVAAIDPEKGIVYLNPTIDIMAISVLLRHEIAHYVFKHRQHMFAKLKALGIDTPSELAYRLANIAGDYHISNEIYDDVDKALVKGINKYPGQLQKIVVDNQDAIGLVTEMDFPENPEYWTMQFDELWDVLVKDYDAKDLNSQYSQNNKNNQMELSDDFIEGWNELIDSFNKKEVTIDQLKELLQDLK